tara:strand:+ start:649 stop:933 length:285 start_codon:yes stop_codon:yes gene_type:complete
MTTVLQIEGLTAKDLFQKFAELEQKIEANIQPHRPVTNQSETYLTRAEVSEQLKVTRQTLSTWHKKDVLRAVRLGTRVRYKLSDIELFTQSKTI